MNPDSGMSPAWTTYAWCFDHGCLHAFSGEPWCTAWWAPLTGATEDEALADKVARFGDAFFYDQLPLAVQAQLADARKGGS